MLQRKKTSSYKGVCWDDTHGKWIAAIVVDGKRKQLGYFDDEETAHKRWLEYRDQHRPRQVVVDIIGEEWREIDRFGDGYFISNKGRVKNTDFKGMGEERLLRPFRDARGYLEVKKGSIHGKIHRLVLEAFVGKSDLYVNHKDFNPGNNCLENLEYVTQRENMTHSALRYKDCVGCVWDTYWKKWVAHIRINGKNRYIGRYNSQEEAFNAYVEKSQELGIGNKYLPKIGA